MSLSFGLLSDVVVFPFIVLSLGGAVYGILSYWWGRRRGKENGHMKWSIFAQLLLFVPFIVLVELAIKQLLPVTAAFCVLPGKPAPDPGWLLYADYYVLPVALILGFMFLTEGSGWKYVKPKEAAMVRVGKLLAILAAAGLVFGVIMAFAVSGSILAVLCR